MEIDAATRRNLELTRTLARRAQGQPASASSTAPSPAPAPGCCWRACPRRLTDPMRIDRRLDMVRRLRRGRRLARRRARSPEALSGPGARARAALAGPRRPARSGGDPRRARLRAAEAARPRRRCRPRAAARRRRIARAVAGPGRARRQSSRCWTERWPPICRCSVRDGGFVASGYRAELDELRRLRDEGRKLIAELEARYVAETGHPEPEDPPQQHARLFTSRCRPSTPNGCRPGRPAPFILRQSMVGAQRYATVELGDLESRIARAADQALALELAMFEELARAGGGAAPRRSRSPRAPSPPSTSRRRWPNSPSPAGGARPIVDDGPGVSQIARRPPPGRRGGDGGARRGRLRRQRSGPRRRSAASGC